MEEALIFPPVLSSSSFFFFFFASSLVVQVMNHCVGLPRLHFFFSLASLHLSESKNNSKVGSWIERVRLFSPRLFTYLVFFFRSDMGHNGKMFQKAPLIAILCYYCYISYMLYHYYCAIIYYTILWPQP